MENSSHDAIIVGAGPAGSSAAAILAEHGRRVLVLEREKFPRYHIGESLIPFTYHPLKRLGMIERLKESAFVNSDGEIFGLRRRMVYFIGLNATPRTHKFLYTNE